MALCIFLSPIMQNRNRGWKGFHDLFILQMHVKNPSIYSLIDYPSHFPRVVRRVYLLISSVCPW